MPRYANKNTDAASYSARPSKYPQGAFKDNIETMRRAIGYLEGATTIP